MWQPENKIPWLFTDFNKEFRICLTWCKIPWLFPDLEFFPHHGNPDIVGFIWTKQRTLAVTRNPKITLRVIIFEKNIYYLTSQKAIIFQEPYEPSHFCHTKNFSGLCNCFTTVRITFTSKYSRSTVHILEVKVIFAVVK